MPLYFETEIVAETASRASSVRPSSARFHATFGIFSSPGDSKLTSNGLGLHWNGHSITFWTPALELVGRNIAPLHFKTEWVAEIALRASWFWPFSARFLGTWGIFSSPGDSKVTPDDLALHWNGQSKTFWTLTFELVGRNIATLYFKTERVAETAFRASWCWSTSARFTGTWGIFSSRGDPKLTFDSFGLQWNAHSKTFWTLTFELVGRNIAPLHFKTERVAETALGAW